MVPPGGFRQARQFEMRRSGRSAPSPARRPSATVAAARQPCGIPGGCGSGRTHWLPF